MYTRGMFTDEDKLCLSSKFDIAAAAAVPNVAVEIPDNVCKTLICNMSATEILNNMDNSVKPCDDFYKFACGGFIEKTTIPDSEISVDAFSVTDRKIEGQIRTTIEEPSSPTEPRYIRILKNYYKSCMNEAAIEKRGLAPLKTKLEELGGWPVLKGDKWNDSYFDWVNSIHQFQKAGFSNNYFLDFDIDTDSKNSTKKVLTIDEPSLGLSRNHLIKGMNNTKVEIYYKLMVDIAVMLGAPRDNAIAELKESLEFEIKLAKMKLPKTETRNLTLLYNPMTVNELSEKYPSIPWKEYINNILAPHVTINNNEIVIVTVPKFVSDLIELISKIPKRVQANYAIWRAVKVTAPFLNGEMVERLSEYRMQFTGVVKSIPRWEKCVQATDMFFTLHAMYIRKYFNGTAKNNSIEMVIEIISQLKKTLQTLDWMDNKTRENALDKAATISAYVGYPDELMNDTILEDIHKNYDFNDDNYLENRLSLTRYMFDDTYSEFRKSINNSDWTKHATTAVANAFYHPMENSINFPAGILQGVFFGDGRPKYMNYGAIGSIIGHEITHAFDDEGRQYDRYGNLENWWSETTDAKFRLKAQCIIDQYSNYTVEEIGKKLDGFNTQGENIADIGGFKIAYLAYKDWSKRYEEEQTLPGLKFNPQQMFWISAANVWCSKTRIETLEMRVTNNPHSPAEFRILGSFRNLPEFAADFNCPVGSKMNPKDKCTVW